MGWKTYSQVGKQYVPVDHMLNQPQLSNHPNTIPSMNRCSNPTDNFVGMTDSTVISLMALPTVMVTDERQSCGPSGVACANISANLNAVSAAAVPEQTATVILREDGADSGVVKPTPDQPEKPCATVIMPQHRG